MIWNNDKATIKQRYIILEENITVNMSIPLYEDLFSIYIPDLNIWYDSSILVTIKNRIPTILVLYKKSTIKNIDLLNILKYIKPEIIIYCISSEPILVFNNIKTMYIINNFITSDLINIIKSNTNTSCVICNIHKSNFILLMNLLREFHCIVGYNKLSIFLEKGLPSIDRNIMVDYIIFD